mmetsp:Transcript_22240/g.46832  ORF Transcript_22240/g.46832 Transcript_22240/m.46832 type:complete len:638 (+) Transcript_22240:14-1927(+)
MLWYRPTICVGIYYYIYLYKRKLWWMDRSILPRTSGVPHRRKNRKQPRGTQKSECESEELDRLCAEQSGVGWCRLRGERRFCDRPCRVVSCLLWIDDHRLEIRAFRQFDFTPGVLVLSWIGLFCVPTPPTGTLGSRSDVGHEGPAPHPVPGGSHGRRGPPRGASVSFAVVAAAARGLRLVRRPGIDRDSVFLFHLFEVPHVFEDVHLAQRAAGVALGQPGDQAILVKFVPAGEDPDPFAVLELVDADRAARGRRRVVLVGSVAAVLVGQANDFLVEGQHLVPGELVDADHPAQALGVADPRSAGEQDDAAVLVRGGGDPPALGADEEAAEEDQKGEESRHGGQKVSSHVEGRIAHVDHGRYSVHRDNELVAHNFVVVVVPRRRATPVAAFGLVLLYHRRPVVEGPLVLFPNLGVDDKIPQLAPRGRRNEEECHVRRKLAAHGDQVGGDLVVVDDHVLDGGPVPRGHQSLFVKGAHAPFHQEGDREAVGGGREFLDASVLVAGLTRAVVFVAGAADHHAVVHYAAVPVVVVFALVDTVHCVVCVAVVGAVKGRPGLYAFEFVRAHVGLLLHHRQIGRDRGFLVQLASKEAGHADKTLVILGKIDRRCHAFRKQEQRQEENPKRQHHAAAVVAVCSRRC